MIFTSSFLQDTSLEFRIDSCRGYHICPRTLFFGDAYLYFEKAIRLSREMIMFLAAI